MCCSGLAGGAVWHIFQCPHLGVLLGVEFPDLGGQGGGLVVTAGGGVGVAGGELRVHSHGRWSALPRYTFVVLQMGVASVATGSGDEKAASVVGGHLRASHADREQVIGTLKTAFVEGMLTKDEFDLRMGQAFTSQTHADLAALTADLPMALAVAHPSMPVRAPGEQRVLRPGPVIMAATGICASVWGVALLTVQGDNHVVSFVVAMTTLTYLVVLLIAGGHMVASRYEKRSGGQPSRRPSVGGHHSQRLPSAGPSRQLPAADPGRRHTAEAVRIVRPCPLTS